MLRVEDKYILSDRDMFLLEKKIACLLPVDGSGTGYKVSSLYFDDLGDSMLSDSLNGNPVREKYRIRIYDDSLRTIKLEVKQKTYNRARKISSTITKEELNALMNGDLISEKSYITDARTLFNLAIKQKGLRPRVNVTYDRVAYLYEPGNVRITFDRNIRANNQFHLFGSKDIHYDSPEGTDSVLEVKYDAFIPHFIMQMLEHGNMIQTANSKYGICREIYEKRGN